MATESLFEDRVDRAVKAFALVSVGWRIGVALSGDDSYGVLLYLSRRVPKENLVAMTIQESDRTSRPEDVALCRAIAKDLGVTHEVFTFKDLYGVTLEELASVSERTPASRSIPVCALCIGLRNDGLALAATRLGLDALADGYNADDWAGNLVRDFLFGPSLFRPEELATEMPFGVKRLEGRVLKVSPFSFMRKRETQEYVDAFHPRAFPEYRCPYAGLLQRAEVRQVSRLIDQLWPDALVGLVGRGLAPRAERTPCLRCGLLAPANSRARLCRVCWAAEVLGLRASGQQAEGRPAS